ncbi:amidase signature domain-containing protein [Aspergillus insuetus]
MDTKWIALVQQVRDRRDNSVAAVLPSRISLPTELPGNVTDIPPHNLDEKDIFITELSVRDLLTKLATRELTAVAVTEAFLRRAALAQKLVNCVTELLPEAALERARFLDEYIAQNGEPLRPLHGLPISVKEHIALAGWNLNFSFVSRIETKSETDGEVLRLLWEAGAVFHARTTQPQSLLHIETSSTIYGETVNPYNTALTSGGSSGGEGALLALRGSCLGVGSDTGGSIRAPAGFCGVYGFKASSGRVPMNGLVPLVMGREQIPSVVGPMSTSREGLELWMKVVCGRKSWQREPSLLPIKWRHDVDRLVDEQGKRKLKVGVMWDDGVVKPHPPVQRALRELVEKLRRHGDVEIIDWMPYNHQRGHEIFGRLLFADGGEYMKQTMAESGEPLRPLSQWAFAENPYCKPLTTNELWEWTGKRDIYRWEYANVWNKTATGTDCNGDLEGMVDVILAPLYAGAASPLNNSKYWAYTSIWNLLDYPGVSFPVGWVDAGVDKQDSGYVPCNSWDEENYRLYQPELYDGAPLALQLVGRRWEDEKVLQALAFIEDRIGEFSHSAAMAGCD